MTIQSKEGWFVQVAQLSSLACTRLQVCPGVHACVCAYMGACAFHYMARKRIAVLVFLACQLIPGCRVCPGSANDDPRLQGLPVSTFVK